MDFDVPSNGLVLQPPQPQPSQEGQCEENAKHMLTKCPQSCGVCSRLEKFYLTAIDGKEKDEL